VCAAAGLRRTLPRSANVKSLRETAAAYRIFEALQTPAGDALEQLLVTTDPFATVNSRSHPLDARRGTVDPGGRVALRCVVDGVMPGAGPRVEYLAPQPAERHQLLHDGLWSTDVPWRQCRRAVHQPLVAV
jgi:hypothetical protein